MSSSDTVVYPNAFDPEKFFLPASNNTKTTLVTGIAPNQFSVINVASTNGFPEEGVISVDNEVIYYRSKTAGSFKNITRGYDGTTAFQHVSGAAVELRWIAAHHNRLKNAIKTIERTLGINPQGTFPDVASRFDAAFNSVTKRSSQIFLQNDGITKTETGYIVGGRLARTFRSQERFLKTTRLAPMVCIDGLVQIQNDPTVIVNNVIITSVDVNDGTGKGVITCNTANFVLSGVELGDVVVVKGTPTNNDAYIVDSILSATQIKVSEVIYGSDQSSGSAVGVISIVDVNNVDSPVKDVFSMAVGFTSTYEADALIFINPPNELQYLRADYDVKNTGALVVYDSPIAVVADYQAPSNSGTVNINNSDIFTLNVGRSRALVFKVRLTGNSSPKSTNVKIEIFGDSGLLQRQYLAEYIDLSIGEFVDNGVWHFENQDIQETTHLYVKITDLASQAFTYTFTLEAEALGNNV